MVLPIGLAPLTDLSFPFIESRLDRAPVSDSRPMPVPFLRLAVLPGVQGLIDRIEISPGGRIHHIGARRFAHILDFIESNAQEHLADRIPALGDRMHLVVSDRTLKADNPVNRFTE